MGVRLRQEHKLIVEYFIENIHQYTTASELSNFMSLSTPTIVNYINDLTVLLNIFDIEIVARAGFGYKLKTHSADDIKNLLESDEFNNSNLVDESQSNIHYIIRSFLADEFVKSSYFEDRLFLNRRTVFNLYKEVSKEVEMFNLDLANAYAKGNTLCGNEHNLRSCINYEVSFAMRLPELDNEKFLRVYVNESYLARIRKVIISKQNKLNLNGLDDTSLLNLAQSLYIAHVRNQLGHHLEYDEETVDRYEKRDSYYLAEKIVNQLVNEMKLELGKAEQVYICIYIVAHRSFVNKTEFPVREAYIDCENLSLDLINYLKRINHFQYIDKNEELIESLSLNLTQIVTQSEFNLHQIYDKSNSSKSLQATLMAIQCADFIYKKYGFKLTGGQIDYLATIIYPVFGYFPFENKMGKAIVVSHINKSVAKGIKERLTRNYENLVNDFKLMNLYELDSYELEDYSFLFTSYPKSQLPKIPDHIIVIPVDTFFDLNEKSQIRGVLINHNMSTVLSSIHVIDNLKIYSNVDMSKKEDLYDLIDSSEDKKIKESLEDYEKYCNFPAQGNVMFITSLISRTTSPKLEVYVLSKSIRWDDSKIRIVVYWDRGSSNTHSSSFENESFAQTIYQLLTKNEIIEMLIKNDDRVMELIKRYVKQINQATIEAGSSFR